MNKDYLIKKSKKGEKLLSLYWFVILFLVASTIVYVVASVYGAPYDVRKIESGFLADKLADCISQGGYMTEKAPTLDKENILEQCGITLEVEDSYGWEDDQFYFLIEYYDFDSKNLIKTIEVGNERLVDFCGANGKTPFCNERRFYVIDRNQEEYEIKLKIAISKYEKNVK